MKAYQLISPRNFKQIEAPYPEIPSGESGLLVVKTSWVSICGSDIPFFTGANHKRYYPLKPGEHVHECVGQVVASSSQKFKTGEHVLAIPEGDQGLAEYFIAQDSKAVQLTDAAATHDSSCIIQPLSTVMNAVDRLDLQANSTVAVIGLGSIGLLFCWQLKKRGVKHIIGIDPLANRCAIAERLGITRTICNNSLDVVNLAQSDPQSWEPPDICIEAVGHQMYTLNNAIALIRQQGTVLAFGVPDHDTYTINYELFFRKNAHLIAAVTPDWSTYLAKARDLYFTHTEELESFITHRLTITDIQKAFDLYEQHEDGTIKIILDASKW